MFRRQIHFRFDQLSFLDELPGAFAEHIRTATDDYITKQKNLNVSESASKEGGKANG